LGEPAGSKSKIFSSQIRVNFASLGCLPSTIHAIDAFCASPFQTYGSIVECMARFVNARRAKRWLTPEETGAYLGVNQARVSQLKAEGHFGQPYAGRFDAQLVRAYADIARKGALARCAQLESKGWIHVESAAAALGVSVE